MRDSRYLSEGAASLRPVNPDTIAQAVAVVVAPLISLIGFFSRRRRLRNEIRENLSLLKQLDKDDLLREHSPAALLLRGRITIDVAKLSGQPLGTAKKPVPKGSVIFSSLLCIALSTLTYYINRNAFIWYSLFPGILAFLSAVSVYGMFLNRELPPPEDQEASPTAQASSPASEPLLMDRVKVDAG
jgi:hypothetical protein